MRLAVALVAMVALLAGTAAPAAPPERPVTFMKVADLKTLLDRQPRAGADAAARIVIVDVRSPAEHAELRIASAVSIPVRGIKDRAAELPTSGLVVLY